MSFASKFETLCKGKMKSPNAVCMELNLSNSIFTYWKKTGARPRKPIIEKICQYFDVDSNYFDEEPTVANFDFETYYKEILSKLNPQEKELIEIYRSFDLSKQAKLINYMMVLKGEDK